jgi:hypothetical protein
MNAESPAPGCPDPPDKPHPVPLPALEEEMLRRAAGAGAVWSDSRRFPRLSANVRCVIETESTYASFGHVSRSQLVWLSDLARGGASFFHGAQLFPGECCTLEFPTGAKRRLEVVWCRRISKEAYLTGCQFASHASCGGA